MNVPGIESRGRKALEAYLSEAGAGVRWIRGGRHQQGRPGAEMEVELPGGERKLCAVEFESNARRVPIEHALHQLRSHSEREVQPVIFAEHLGRPMRERLRQDNVWFGDLSGNRFFKSRGFLVDREVAEKSAQAKKPAASVFADRNSRLLRYLLVRPAQQVGVRELAGKIGVSPSAVSNSLGRLREMGYLESNQQRLELVAREDLLEEWVSFYRPRFRRQDESRYYVHARSAEELLERLKGIRQAADPAWGLSLHGGASLVAGFVQFREVQLYISPEQPRLEADLARALQAKPAEGEANLVVLSPFYRHSVLFESRVVEGLRVVSDLQLFLDLSCFAQRGKEQAEVILERRLRPAWAAK
jgi:hypothetical protein